MTIELKPYDHEVVDAITHSLINDYNFPANENGVSEIPADTYQLIINGIEAAEWMTSGEDFYALRKAKGILEWLRDKQKLVEHNRKEK